MIKQQAIACKTIISIEVKRIFRIWLQTILPPAITTLLYFVIFGHVVGSRVGEMGGYKYIQFIAPGLIMMNIIISSYTSTATGFFSAKFQRNIEEVLVSPAGPLTILCGYMGAGIMRGLIVGVIVSLIALGFTHLHMHSVIAVIFAGLIASCIFSLIGVISAIYAKSYDNIAIVPAFVLTPLTYLGGVFYSITLLPPIWQSVSAANPIIYIIDVFRFGFLGISDGHVLIAYCLMTAFMLVLIGVSYHLIRKGIGLRS